MITLIKIIRSGLGVGGPRRKASEEQLETARTTLYLLYGHGEARVLKQLKVWLRGRVTLAPYFYFKICSGATCSHSKHEAKR